MFEYIPGITDHPVILFFILPHLDISGITKVKKKYLYFITIHLEKIWYAYICYHSWELLNGGYRD